MKKSHILAVTLLLAVFSSLVTIAPMSTTVYNVTAPSIEESSAITPKALGDPVGLKGILAANLTDTGTTITADGDVTEWDVAGVPHDVFGGADVYLAFDATNAYVGLVWQDSSNDVDTALLNNTGEWYPDNQTVVWDALPGEDDVASIGFSQGSFADVMVWTASNRTLDGYAYEMGIDGTPDGGTTPFVINNIGTVPNLNDPVFPTYVNDTSTTLPPNQTTLADGVKIAGYPGLGITPTGSQTDVTCNYSWNAIGVNQYVVEFIRPLSTGNADDFDIEFNNSLTFWVGVANKDDTLDMSIDMISRGVAYTNEAADLTLDPVDPVQDDALLLTGNMFDDYQDYQLYVMDPTWADTYYPGAAFSASVTQATGNWSFLYFYDVWDMPLGDHTNAMVVLDAPYEDPLVEYYNFTVVDNEAPDLQGVVNITERYNGVVPYNEDEVTVTCALDDNYNPYDLITGVSHIDAYLYYYKGDDVPTQIPMEHFANFSSTYLATMPIEHGETEVYTYTYFIQAWDPELNKVRSATYTFDVEPATIVQTTPGFGILAGLFGAAAAVFIIKKRK